MALFGTAGIRGPVSEVPPSLALRVGRAMAGVISSGESGPSVVVGRDGRTTGQAMAAALTAGLVSGGLSVRRVGQVPTPALAFASQTRFGVMLTASHNPPADTGIKLFVDGVEFDSEHEGEIEGAIEANEPPVDWDRWGTVERAEVLDPYLNRLVSYGRSHGTEPGSLAVAVDSGNGMASVATPRLLRRLGASVESINSHVDGRFPGRTSKPTPETIDDLCRFVADGPASVGFAHDGDADRVVVVDEFGEVVHEDTVVAILAEHYVRTSNVADPVVITTPNASARIDERVEAAGGRVARVALGALHEGIAAARDRGDHVVFAGEPWKHLHPDLGGWIDGVASAAVLTGLIAEAGGLDSLRAPVSEPPYRKISVPCPGPKKRPAIAKLATSLPSRFPEATVSDEFGVRLDLDAGAWLLVRPSGTEPYIRIYAEGDDVETVIETARSAVVQAVESAQPSR